MESVMSDLRSIIVPVPVGARQGWTVEVDGQVVPAYHVRISSKFGAVTYGQGPGGYDTWSFREPGGGGSVVVVFSQIGAELFIGLVDQNRPNQGGMVKNLVRGFLEPGQSHYTTAKREVEEEMGESHQFLRPFELDGQPVNPNSTFFETWQAPGDGVHFFGIEVPASALHRDADGVLVFREGCLRPNSGERTAEQILGCAFIPTDEALALGDGFTVIGIARLERHLRLYGPKRKS